MIRDFIDAFKKVRADRKLSASGRVGKEILYDPMSIELIGKIARDCGSTFEVIRPVDGVTFRFYKEGMKQVTSLPDWENY
jgi:hypothetical protein